MARVDQYQASRSGGTGAAAAAGDDAAHAPSPPPAPASRARAGSSNAYNSSRTPTTNAPSSSVFVGIDAEQKHAFFSLLDEYFDSRPQYRDLLRPNDFGRTTTTTRAADVPAAASRPAPPPRKTTTTTQAPGLGMARALYDYDATTADDLAFREGDRITVLEHSESLSMAAAAAASTR